MSQAVKKMAAGDVKPGMYVRIGSGRYQQVNAVEEGPTQDSVLEILARAKAAAEAGDYDEVRELVHDLPGLCWVLAREGTDLVRLVTGLASGWSVNRDKIVSVRW